VREWLYDDCGNQPCNFAQQELDPVTFGSVTIDTIASIGHLLPSLDPAHTGKAVCNWQGMACINESDTSTTHTSFGSLWQADLYGLAWTHWAPPNFSSVTLPITLPASTHGGKATSNKGLRLSRTCSNGGSLRCSGAFGTRLMGTMPTLNASSLTALPTR
jgi:hypothetical protein